MAAKEMMRRLPFVCAFGLSMNALVLAQDGSTPLVAPARQPAVAQAAPHKFFDAANISLTAVESGALIADGITTQHLIGLCGGPSVCGWRELDPIARPFVERGWPGQIAGGALFVSAEVGLRYLLHKHGHHRLERWLPMVLTIYGMMGAIHNARLY